MHHLRSRPRVPSGLTVWGGWGAVGADGLWLTAPPPQQPSRCKLNLVSLNSLLHSHAASAPAPSHPAQGEAGSAPAGETRFSRRWQARAERPTGTRAPEGKNQPRPPPCDEPGTRPQALGELPQDRGVSRRGADRSRVQTGELLLEEVLFTPEPRCARCPVVGSGVGDLRGSTGPAPRGARAEGCPWVTRNSLFHLCVL